jgi:hypothetical protein
MSYKPLQLEILTIYLIVSIMIEKMSERRKGVYI